MPSSVGYSLNSIPGGIVNIEKPVVLPARKGRPNAYLVLHPEGLKRGLRNALFGRYEVIGMVLGTIMVILGGLGWVASIRLFADRAMTSASMWQFIFMQTIAVGVMIAGGSYVFGVRSRHWRTLDIAYGSLRRYQVLSDEDPIYQAIMTGELFSRLAQGNVDRRAIAWLSLYVTEAEALHTEMNQDFHDKRFSKLGNYTHIKDAEAKAVLESIDSVGHKFSMQRKLIELAGKTVQRLEALLEADLSAPHANMLMDLKTSFGDFIEDAPSAINEIEKEFSK